MILADPTDEKEINVPSNYPEISILGGFIEEFIGDINHICSTRTVLKKNKMRFFDLQRREIF